MEYHIQVWRYSGRWLFHFSTWSFCANTFTPTFLCTFGSVAPRCVSTYLVGWESSCLTSLWRTHAKWPQKSSELLERQWKRISTRPSLSIYTQVSVVYDFNMFFFLKKKQWIKLPSVSRLPVRVYWLIILIKWCSGDPEQLSSRLGDPINSETSLSTLLWTCLLCWRGTNTTSHRSHLCSWNFTKPQHTWFFQAFDVDDVPTSVSKQYIVT